MKHLNFTPYLSLIGAILLTSVCFSLRASDIISVSPITDQILLIYLEDGHVDTYGPGETVYDNVGYASPLLIKDAMDLSNYYLSSSDDANYASEKNPVHIGRKSKGIDFVNDAAPTPIILGHWIYVELPTPMVAGKTYTLATRNVAENVDKTTFTFDVEELRSETIHVNQVAFAQNSKKYAYLSQWMGSFSTATHQNGGLTLDDYAGTSFRVVNFATGQTAYSGVIAKRRDKSYQESDHPDFAGNYTQADVWECDFSALTAPGEYVVVVDKIGRSFAFEIGNEALNEPFYYAMKGLFWQRQGVWKEQYDGKVIPADHTGTWRWDNEWNPGAGHSTDGYSEGRAIDVDGLYGHYFDAGDWDTYLSHNGVVMPLLLLYDLTPERFTDGEVGNRYKRQESDPWIDEGNNGLPDLLDEASWLIKYQRRARNLLRDNYGGTGGVPVYTGRDGLPDGNSITAWQDTRTWRIAAEDPEMTFYYAGHAAYYATCLNEFHQLTQSGAHPEAAAWIAEAEDAYAWSITNAKAAGAERKDNERRAKGYAAAALYRATGDTKYQTEFQDYFAWDPAKGEGEWTNPNVVDIAASLFSQIPNGFSGLDATLKSNCVDHIIAKADLHKVGPIMDNGYRQPIERGQFAGLGGVTTPRVTLVPVAYQLTGDDKYLETIQHATSYALGGNQMNTVFLSGLGERYDDYVFSPNAYLTSDYNSKVYSPESYIGHTSYFTTTFATPGAYWFFGGTNSEYFSQDKAFPSLHKVGEWPGTERKTYNRFSIQGGEFTVPQQNNYMIYAMGSLKALANAPGTYRLQARPTVSINLSDGQEVSLSDVTLTASASADTRYVDYYYEWHYIGRSSDKASGFSLTWNPPLPAGTQNVLVTAVAYDDKGRISLPSADGDKTVNIVAGPNDDTQAPTVPGALTTSDVERSSFGLSWSASSDNEAVFSYRVLLNGELIGKTDKTTFFLEDLTPSTDYSMQVQAVDQERNASAASEALVIRTKDVDPGDGGIFTQSSAPDGMVSMEAEHFSTRAAGTGKFLNRWWLDEAYADVSGGEAMELADQGNNSQDNFSDGPVMNFRINFVKTGSHYLWIRVLAPSGGDDSVYPALDGNSLGQWNLPSVDRWAWRVYGESVVNKTALDIPTTGERTLSFYMREDGVVIDKILVTVDPNFFPTDFGPAESNRTGEVDITPPPSADASATTAVVSHSSDDAEEAANNSVSLNSDDLDLRAGNLSAVRFALDVPQGANVTDATVSLVAKGNTAGANTLTFSVEPVSNATTFSSSSANLSNRPTTGSVSWSPGSWADGETYTSPDLSELIQTVVNRSDWAAGNHIAIRVSATASNSGKRAARTYDYNGNSSQAPELSVSYREPDGDGESTPPGSDGLITLEAEDFTNKVAGSGNYSNAMWELLGDSEASGAQYMTVPDNNNQNAGNSLSGPRLNYAIDITESGAYYLWIRVIAPTPGDDSCIPAIDGDSRGVWAIGTSSTWTWKQYALGDISAGSRTLSLHMREDGLWVDKLIVTNDAGYTPDANARLAAGSKRVGDTLPDNLAPGLTVYPNPSTGTVQVVLPEKALVQVHNSQGQLVLERPLAAGRTSLDLSELGRGVHTLSATTVQGQRQVKRLLLE